MSFLTSNHQPQRTEQTPNDKKSHFNLITNCNAKRVLQKALEY